MHHKLPEAVHVMHETLARPGAHFLFSLWTSLGVCCLCTVLALPAFGATQVEKNTSYRIVVDLSNEVRGDFQVADFLGVNLNYLSFQRQLWDPQRTKVKGNVVDMLRTNLPNARYRYPGGMVANNFVWSSAMGPLASRAKHRDPYSPKNYRPDFGLDEYLNFTAATNGRQWHVLNLVGKNPGDPLRESPSADVAASNKALASYLATKNTADNAPRYYQLGNELDRSKYEWSHEKYAARSQKTIEAIQQVDPDARFVAFMRGFNYRYRKSNKGNTSTSEALFRDVMRRLPSVQDYSLMQYYDGARTDGKSWSVPFWIKKIEKTIGLYGAERNGEKPRVWITEHARQSSSNRAGADNSRRVTSNQSAAVSTADYLIALTQIPEVKGAFWHGLNAGPWQMFDVSAEYMDLSARPVFWALANFATTNDNSVVYATKTFSRNESGYVGKYDLRATALGNSAGSITLWVANRAPATIDVSTQIADWRNKSLNIVHCFTAGTPGMPADSTEQKRILALNEMSYSRTMDQDGTFTLSVPPLSVSTFTITLDQ